MGNSASPNAFGTYTQGPHEERRAWAKIQPRGCRSNRKKKSVRDSVLNPSFRGADGLKVLWEDGERVFCRGESNGDGACVLVVRPAAEHPVTCHPRSTCSRIRIEGRTGRRVGCETARARARARTDHAPASRIPAGEPLDRLIGPPMGLELFLRLAVALSAAVGQLHRRGLVHKDIKPANILVNVSTGQVWLTGFGIASRLPRERQSPDPPELLEGTLAYMAPEQTGRMNRSIDSRSDLYSLGVTLYQMLTGTSALHGFRSDGVGALPYRQKAAAAQ